MHSNHPPGFAPWPANLDSQDNPIHLNFVEVWQPGWDKPKTIATRDIDPEMDIANLYWRRPD